ncbi:MAG: hypothetical protein Q4C42_07885, partial [Clostridia bacterium]|nr:hypothetical protein [Clostridia bacterium]
GTFIKRCSNLIVLSQSGEYIDSSEISYALREMTEDIRAFGVPCHTDFSIEGNCEVSLAISILDYITRALRSGVKNMKSVNFRLLASQGMLTIRLMIEGVSELSSDHADIEGIDMSIFVKSENNSVTADILCWEAK